MAFAQIRSQTSGGNFSTTSPTTVLPATIIAGDKLLLALAVSAASTFTFDAGASGWTQVLGETNAGGVGFCIYTKTADGTEDGATLTHTLGTSRAYAYRVWALSDAGDIEVGTTATGTSAGPDSPSVNPAGWGTEDTLWIALASNFNATVTASGYPTSYTGGASQAGGGASGVNLATAVRENATATEDPSAFTIGSSVAWRANTIAVRPGSSSTLTDVDTDESVVAGQANVIWTGTGLSAIDGVKITVGTASVTGGIDSASSTSVQADIPTDASAFTAGVPWGSATLIVTTAGATSASIAGTFALSSTYYQHDVTDISQAADADCLYNGKTPAVAVGNKVAIDALSTSRGWAVTIDSQGFPQFATGGSNLTDSVQYRIWDATDSTWGTASTYQRTVQPTLSSASGASATSTTAILSVATDVPEGTVWAVVTTSATTPTHAQIKAGQSHLGVAAVYAGSNGTVTATTQITATGLTEGVTYYAHFAQENAATSPLSATPVSSASWSQLGATAITATGKRIRRLVRPRIQSGV